MITDLELMYHDLTSTVSHPKPNILGALVSEKIYITIQGLTSREE